jgi:putative protease
LCFLDDNRQLQGFRVNRVEGNRLFPLKMPQGLRPGMRLFRNSDQDMERLLSKPSAERRIPVTMRLRATDKGFALQMDDVEVELPLAHQTAEKPQRDNIVRQLTKLGGTPYECSQVDMPEDFNFFIPSSLLAELRRLAVEKLRFRPSKVTLSPLESYAFAPRKLRFCKGTDSGSVPSYPLPYLFNVSNQRARNFYAQQGINVGDAFELRPPRERLLMQCRHCLRYTLGFCVRNGGQQPSWREPLFLRLGDGRRFRLEFDCKNCQMNVYADEK